MARPLFLVSTLIMGVALLLVVWYSTRGLHADRSLTTRLNAARTVGGGGTADETGTGEPSVSGAGVGMILLLVLLLGVGVAVGVAADASSIVIFSGVLAGMIGVYLLWGIYHIARVRGLKYSQAVGFGLWFLGLLLLGGIVMRLLLGG